MGSGYFEPLIPGTQRQASIQGGLSICRPCLASSSLFVSPPAIVSATETSGGAMAHRSRLHLRIGLSRFMPSARSEDFA
jgi:hypothetical protein